MNDPGATVNFNGELYSVDSSKLTSAKNNFVSHLGTIAGSGTKVTINEIEYEIDSTKTQDAIDELNITLMDLHSIADGIWGAHYLEHILDSIMYLD